MRFSVRWLFGAVAFVAIGCFSLIYASEPISRVLNAALFAFLMVAILGALFAIRTSRPFWAGCAVVGLSYVATAYLPQQRVQRSQVPWLATDAILIQLHSRVVSRSGYPTTGPFHAAGQALATFVWAIAGGFVAGWFRRGAQPSDCGHPSRVSSPSLP
jgi:hypothetical protein